MPLGCCYITQNFNFVAGGSLNDIAISIARANDGALTVVGNFSRPAPGNPTRNRDCGVMRLLPEGAGYDKSFAAPNGFRTLALDLAGDNADDCDDVAVLADGSTWIAGVTRDTAVTGATGSGFVTRLLPNGKVDSNFFADGVFLLNNDLPQGVSVISSVADVQVDSAGRVLVAGNIRRGIAPNVSDRGVLLRFLSDGTLDSEFGTGGFVQLADFNPPTVLIYHLSQDSQGRVLVFDTTTSAFPGTPTVVIFRLLDSGAPDTSFGTGMTALGGGGRGFVQRCRFFGTVHLDSSDRILAACLASTTPPPAGQGQLIRLLPNGLVDLNFGSAGVTPVAFEYNAIGTPIGESDFPSQILTQPDGKILVTGTHYAAVAADWGTRDVGVQRLFSNCTPDLSFGQNRSASLFRFQGRNQRQETVSAAILEPNGRMIIVGSLSRAPVFGGSNEIDFLVMAVRTATPKLPEMMFADSFE